MSRWLGIIARTAFFAALLVVADPWLPGYAMVQPATPGTSIGVCDATFVLDIASVPVGEVPAWRAAVRMMNQVTNTRFDVVRRRVTDPGHLAQATGFRNIPVVYRDNPLPGFRNSDGVLAAAYGDAGEHPTNGEYTRMIVVNRATVDSLPSGAEPGGRFWVYMHEIGHVVGLEHNEFSTSLMFPAITRDVGVSWQDAADLRTVTRRCRPETP